MSYREIRLLLPSDRAEALSDAILAHGALSVAIEDAYAGTAEEQEIFGEPGEAGGLWNNSLVIALFTPDYDIDAALRAACAELSVPMPKRRECEVPEQDWVRLTQAQFDPVAISSRLWIVPSWHEAPDAGAINLKLDPGLAFGTGSHPTTRLCLRWLDKNLRPGQSVLDYGCGSGILAIAALKLGAGSAVGVDIDPQAVAAARANAETNDVNACFSTPEELSEAQSFDIVLANILANPLRLLVDLLAARVKKGGQIVLSGLLAEQTEEISAIYGKAGFVMQNPEIDDGWACLTGVKS